MFSASYGHCHPAVFSAPYGHCPSELFSVPCGHFHLEVLVKLWSLSLCIVQCPLWPLSPCSVQRSLCSLALCSLPPLCSGNEIPWSLYGFTSKQCSSQSPLPFQHSAVPKILQWTSTFINLQPSWHPRCYFLSPKLTHFFQPQHYLHWQLSRTVNIYTMLQAVWYTVADLLRILS